MEINLLAGFDAARALPSGQGVQSHAVNGFRIQMLSNHDVGDTFELRITALYTPDRSTMTWPSITADIATAIIAATISFSDRTFGESNLDLIDRQLIDAIIADNQ